MNNTLDSREKCSLESPIFDLFPQEIFNEKYTPLRMLLNTLNPAQKEALLQQTENLESVFQEQERKFLLHSLPENFSQYPSASVQQHYLFTQDPEVRIRQKGEEYFLTIKRGTGIIRTEIEISLSPQTFQELLPLTTVSITKKRSAIPLNDGHIAEVDLYPNGLQIVEVEFKDQESLTSFSVPPWFGAEVSGKKEYANVNLATPKEPTLQKVEIETSTEIKEINSIEKFEVGQWIQEIIRRTDQLAETQDYIIINIAGGSASGKTSQVAKKIFEHYPDQAILISMDNYYKGTSYMQKVKEKEGIILNYDQPEVIDIALLQQQLWALKQGETIQQPLYDFVTGERTGYTPLPPKKIIIVEGLFPLVEELAQKADIKTYVDVSLHGMILRRLMRDIDRGSRTIAQNMKYILDTVKPMQEKYIDPTVRNADLVISNDYNPVIESSNAKAQEHQIKFEKEISLDTLRKLWAEKLASTQQTDFYYPSKGGKEFVRIRKEGENLIFGYKGPRGDDGKKCKLEFEIDEETKNLLTQHYGKIAKTISKKRDIFSLKGVIFSLDRIKQTEGEKNFIEIRLPDGKEANIEEFYQKLWLKKEEGKEESYFDLLS